jgi:abhydrolase domain-containing protein 12
LITDGITLVNFILSLGIPSSRIAIVGQSLGTAVASAVSLHFADSAASADLLPKPIAPHFPELVLKSAEPIDFAGVFLIASFSSLPKLLLSYRIAGYVPILSPLRSYHRLRGWFLDSLVDQWNTSTRLAALTSAVTLPGRKLRLHIIHARNDWEIPWLSGEENFNAAEKALKIAGVNEGVGEKSSGDITTTVRKAVWLGTEERVTVTLEVIPFGGEFLSNHHLI